MFIFWEDDEKWYDAFVVRYYPKKREFKLVYTADDCVEITSLDKRRWRVAPKWRSNTDVTVGAVIRFIYPKDEKPYLAMIYERNEDASRLKVAYIEDFATDVVKGNVWNIMKPAPVLPEFEDDDSSSSSSSSSSEDDDDDDDVVEEQEDDDSDNNGAAEKDDYGQMTPDFESPRSKKERWEANIRRHNGYDSSESDLGNDGGNDSNSESEGREDTDVDDKSCSVSPQVGATQYLHIDNNVDDDDNMHTHARRPSKRRAGSSSDSERAAKSRRRS